MKKVDILNITTNAKNSISLFEDDTIDVIRQRIAVAANSHPDRLFILVKLKLPKDYYIRDPRRLESLYNRLSLDDALTKDIFELYLRTYRDFVDVKFEDYSKSEWMEMPDSLKTLIDCDSDFHEFRIFGVNEDRSFILPFKPIETKIKSTRNPIPLLESLFSSLYDIKQLISFSYFEYSEEFTGNLIYFPYFRETSITLNPELVGLLNKNTTLLDKLLKLDVPKPTDVSILRTRFYVPWVSTDFGSAIYSRFEQIFYGLTVSPETPYICFFTSKDEINRHKFYVEDPKTKKPVLDMSVWNSWWTLTKPSREKPTLLLYRGTSKHNFDRIAITAIDLIVSNYREDTTSETIEDMQTSSLKWLESLDSFIPFIDKPDIDLERWELQDLNYQAKYDKKIKEFNLLRMNCISSLFSITDKNKSEFTLLRTDRDMSGLSAIDVKLIAMSKDGDIKAADVSADLSVTLSEATKLITEFRAKIAENTSLLNKSIRKFPNINIGETTLTISFVNNMDLSLKYANILRFILTEDSEELDQICPKRVERVEAKAIPVADEQIDDEAFADMFAEYEEEVVEEQPEPEEELQTITTGKKETSYSYFKTKLEKYYPEIDSRYPKQCEKNRQPIILSDEDIEKIPAKYSLDRYEKGKIIKNDKGTIVCPEYWCSKDEIPLMERDLIDLACPICKGKLMDGNPDLNKYPLMKRDTGFNYPGYTKKTNLPCCYKTPTGIETDKPSEKYYIVGETKVPLEEYRLAFLPKDLIRSLKIDEDYEKIGSHRIQAGSSGFFRVGLSNPSKTLAKFLDLKSAIPKPHEAVNIVLQCSFLKMWTVVGTTHIEAIQKQFKDLSKESVEKLSPLISGISEAFANNSLKPLEELEYCANVLQCEVFRINMKTNSLGCMFYAPLTYARKRGILVLQNDEYIDILSFAERSGNNIKFKSNIFQEPFTKPTESELVKMRNEVCKTSLPSYSDALTIIKILLEKLDTSFEIILDPYGLAQAFYVAKEIVLPFQSTNLPDAAQVKLKGYEEIDPPSEDKVVAYLKEAEKINKGYAFKEYGFSTTQKVEIITESGLRIPIQPIDSVHESTEIIQTVNSIGENKLVFDDESKDLRENQQKISYSAEVYEFLLFQLAHDIENGYNDLNILIQSNPTAKKLEPELKKWFDDTVNTVDIKHPEKFLSKIRTPCGQFKKDSCTGNLCGWKDGKCNVQVKSSINTSHLFNRLMTTLVDNPKIRAMIADGRITPFFSTILYLELPHELIVTDKNLP